jgi:hypothetical protein
MARDAIAVSVCHARDIDIKQDREHEAPAWAIVTLHLRRLVAMESLPERSRTGCLGLAPTDASP